MCNRGIRRPPARMSVSSRTPAGGAVGTKPMQNLILADSIRCALSEAAIAYGQRTGIPSYRYLETAPKSEINLAIAVALAPAANVVTSQEVAALAHRVIREYEGDYGMTMGLSEDARALLTKLEASK